MTLDRRALLATSAALGVAACTTVPEDGHDPEPRIASQLDMYGEDLLATYPENATQLGLDRDRRAELKSRLTDRSAAGVRRRADEARQRLSGLREINLRQILPPTRTAAEAAIYAHEIAVEGHGFAYGDVQVLDFNWAYANTPYVVNPGTGFFASVPDFLDSKHTVETDADAEAYLARLEAFAVGLDAESERVAADGARGVIPPNFTLDTAIVQLADYRRRPVEQWGLLTSLVRRTSRFHDGDRYGERAMTLCRERVAPALERQIAALQGVRTRATSDAGVWKLPDGEAYYAWALKASTTTERTPREVHRQGLEENATLKARMETLLRAQGLTQGTVGARMTALGRDPANLWPNDEAGRTALLEYLEERTADIRARMPRAFSSPPAAPVEIRRVPPETEAGAPNGYASAPSVDGTRPGTYYINLRTTGNWPKFALPTLTYHEAVPGHIWQFAYAGRTPLLQSLLAFNAYTEGWGLYAEQLAEELGVYGDDPLGELGYLQSLQFRACRLIVDTGMHAFRWDRERCLRFMVEETGRPESAMTNEVNRYAFWPGQACGYKVGHTEILRLREGARRRLGARFDGRAFNDLVIGAGSVPLALLERIVARWAAA